MIFRWSFSQHPVFHLIREYDRTGHLAGLRSTHRCCEIIDQICHVGIGRALSPAGEQFAICRAAVDPFGVFNTPGILQETRDSAWIVMVHLGLVFTQSALVVRAAVYNVGRRNQALNLGCAAAWTRWRWCIDTARQVPKAAFALWTIVFVNWHYLYICNRLPSV